MIDPRAIVFDLDDTLISEREYARSGFEAVAHLFTDPLGPPGAAAERMNELFDSADRGHIFDRILAECGIEPSSSFVQQLVHAYRRHAPKISLLPDADAALVRFRSSCKLGLITDGFAATQHKKILAVRLDNRLDAITVTDDWGRKFWKPHPRAFEAMARQLGVPADRCTYVADNAAKDFIAPNALGWTTVQIKRSDAVHADAPPADHGAPHRVITSLDQL